MNMIDQNPNNGMFDLWGPLWKPIQWRCFADGNPDGSGGGGGGDDDVNDDTDNDDSKADDSQTDKVDTNKAAEETAVKEAVDISKKFDEQLEEVEKNENDNPEDDGKTPSGDDKKVDEDKDKKGDEEDSAKKDADGKDSRTDDEKKDEGISDALLERAVKTGLSLTDAKSFNNSEALEKTVGILEKSQAAAGDKASDDKTGKTDTENKDADDKKIEFKPFEVKPFEVKFDKEDEIEPDIAKNITAITDPGTAQIKALHEHYAEQINAVFDQLQQANTQVKSMQSAMDHQGAAKFETEFEGLVKGLGDEYEDLVGKGVGKDLDKNGTQMANRNKLIGAMQVVDEATIKAGKKLLPQDEVFKQATAIVFSDKATELATKKVVDKVKTRAEQGLNRATGTKGKPLTPQQEAVQASKDFDVKLDATED